MALGTAQQYLALVPREYRMISNQDERGFATVTFTFFFFSPGHRAIQNTKSNSQRGGIKPLCGHGQYSRMIFFYHVLVMSSDSFLAQLPTRSASYVCFFSFSCVLLEHPSRSTWRTCIHVIVGERKKFFASVMGLQAISQPCCEAIRSLNKKDGTRSRRSTRGGLKNRHWMTFC
jgi:hypothetical protein